MGWSGAGLTGLMTRMLRDASRGEGIALVRLLPWFWNGVTPRAHRQSQDARSREAASQRWVRRSNAYLVAIERHVDQGSSFQANFDRALGLFVLAPMLRIAFSAGSLANRFSCTLSRRSSTIQGARIDHGGSTR